MPQYINCGPSDQIDLQQQYRLTYSLFGASVFPSSWLRAPAIEQRLMQALPQVGLVVRNLPSATNDDETLVLRVQPTDLLKGKTVAQLADKASMSGWDFTVDALLSLDVSLDVVDYLGVTPAKTTPTMTPGTSTTGGDSAAKTNAENQAAKDDFWTKLGGAAKVVGIVIALGIGAYLYVNLRKRS